MLKRLLPGGAGSGGANTKGIFYYPRNAFGQISTAYQEAAKKAGAEILLNARVVNINNGTGGQTVTLEMNGQQIKLQADQVFSTIPVTTLINLIDPKPPAEITQAANSLVV